MFLSGIGTGTYAHKFFLVLSDIRNKLNLIGTIPHRGKAKGASPPPPPPPLPGVLGGGGGLRLCCLPPVGPCRHTCISDLSNNIIIIVVKGIC